MISLLIVNYRSAALAIDAIRTARAAACEPLQVVVVDNSCDDSEAMALRPHADTLIASVTNRGYAGAINDGRKSCAGDAIVVANPDVTFASEAIDRLVSELDSTVGVAGPALFWDDSYRWILPPSDLHTAWDALDAALASRSRAWFALRDRRRFLRRVAFWSLDKPSLARALSGAVLAIRTADFDAVGGFDERFALYFEETDFLRRIAAQRKRIKYIPAARCRHLYDQSASQVATEASASYAVSEMRYLEKWNGPFFARAVKRLERPPFFAEPQPLDGPIEIDRLDVVIEVSPLPTFTTAAGHFPIDRSTDLPPEVWAAFRGRELYFRVVERGTAKVRRTYVRRIRG